MFDTLGNSDGKGTSVIKHNQQVPGHTATEGRTGGCSEPGCHQADIKYDAEIVQIESLIEISGHCEQSVYNNCTHVPLSSYSWWTDRNGNRREYWHGNFTNGQKGCQCAFTESGCTPNFHGVQVNIAY